MQLSPSTLSVIVAALSSDGLTPTHDQVRALLQPLTGEEPQPTETVLREGERFLIINHATGDNDIFNTLADVLGNVKDDAIDSYGDVRRDPSDYDIYVIRGETLDVNIKASVDVTIGG